ncbi:hypothetical protein ACQPXH_23665 [Nocardia sp. CA-135953]|uniref:hypothetical protein n=1 Tax=Nocardia sp. CA-135953 TaxID=3239978 RepID=UPI003D96CB96
MWDETQIRSLAKRFGYDLAKTITAGRQTEHPIAKLLETARRLDVDAVIVPSAEHLGGDVPEQLVKVCDVITVSPVETYARWAAIRFVDVDGG